MSVAYSDWDELDTEEYVWRNYGNRILKVDQDLIAGITAALQNLEIEPESLQHAADVGTGPNLYPAMLLAPFIRQSKDGGRLELIELSASNRKYLQRALSPQGAHGALAGIWGRFQTLMAGHGTIWRDAFSRVRDVGQVKSGSILDLPADAYDAVSSFFVTESITDSRKEFERVTDKLLAAVKPGGLVVIGHMIDSTSWHAGEKTFPAVPLTINDIQELYDGRLEHMTIVPSLGGGEIRADDHGVVAVVARKVARASSWRAAPQTGGTGPEHSEPNNARPIPTTALNYELSDQQFETFSSAYMSMHDIDHARLGHLFDAIRGSGNQEGAVKPGDIVIEFGGGRGWLSVAAACAGASKVYCVERDSESLKIARGLAAKNGVLDRIEFIKADILEEPALLGDTLPKDADVLICEIFSNAFFYEPQMQAILAGLPYLKVGGRIIPEAVSTSIELIEAQTRLLGLKLPRGTRWQHLEGDISLTDRAVYDWTEFDKVTEENVQIRGEVVLTARTNGMANAVRISPDIWVKLPQGSDQGIRHNRPSITWGNPDIIFLKDGPIEIKAGQTYIATITYEAGEHPDKAKIVVRPARHDKTPEVNAKALSKVRPAVLDIYEQEGLTP